MLGEYPFTGATPFVAGILFGLVVSEVMLAFRPVRAPALGAVGGALCGAGLGWAVWISSGHGVAPIPFGAWLAVGLGTTIAAGRLAGIGGRVLRARRSGAPGTTPGS